MSVLLTFSETEMFVCQGGGGGGGGEGGEGGLDVSTVSSPASQPGCCDVRAVVSSPHLTKAQITKAPITSLQSTQHCSSGGRAGGLAPGVRDGWPGQTGD